MAPCLQTGIHVEHGPSSVRDHLSRLPLEMLAEILSYTSSPDILSLARTSRFFCATLVTNPASLFIWRAARRRFHPRPIPDPAPNWTESAYIAFIFDTAACEVCHRPTRRTPFSYALRARLCDSRRCHKTWTSSLVCIATEIQSHDDVAAVQSWLPSFENASDGNPGSFLVRPSDSLRAILQYRRYGDRHSIAFSREQFYAKKALLKSEIMQHAQKLRIWGQIVEQWRNDVRRYNRIILEYKAGDEMWLLQDFVNTPIYTGFRKMKDALGEKVSERDFELLKDETAEQVAQCRKVRIRRAVEETSRVTREDIRDHWNMLKTAAKIPLPPYSEFLRLDMVRTLLKKNTDHCTVLQPYKESVREELKTNAATRMHVAQQINAWIQDKKNRLSEILGYDDLALAKEAGFVHPVDRVTAWFKCTRCSRVEGKAQDDKALTFAGVCSHRCLGQTDKDRQKGAWDVKLFEPDQKAIAATKEVLVVSNLKERFATNTQLDALRRRLLCKICEEPIVMDFSSLIGHCRRHEIMDLELLTLKQASLISPTLVRSGLTAKLTGLSKSGSKQRQKRVFGCRHCRKGILFSFDGLRSHVKSKHDIIHMGDEDFFQKRPTRTIEAGGQTP